MPRQTKIFRVFVSSTFTDMREERRILQKEVFPELEKFCEENGAKFQGVDLRWGINEESALNQKTLQICFNEISRCQRISPKPNFIILLGNKYGWQPIPEIIPELEMLAIQQVLSNPERSIINKWYFRDENAIPPEYVLQPRSEELKDYKKWEPIEIEIRQILRIAINKLNFSQDQKVKYFCSATHQEIIRGALDPNTNSAEHVLALVRQINSLPNDKSAEGFIDLTNSLPDEYCSKQLVNLKSELKDKLGEHCITYSTEWINNKSEISEIEHKKFKNHTLSFLKEIISSQLALVTDKDEIELEAKHHKEFKEKLTEHFYGRKEILSKISSYISSNERKALLLIGDSGSGKSSVIAKAILEFEDKKINAVLVYRFIGTTSSSSNIISLLRSICGQIAKEFNTTLESIAGEGQDKSLYDINGLTEIFRKCLTLATVEKPIVVFLDAIDQLSGSENLSSLFWIPRELPEHTKIVISTLPAINTEINDVMNEHLPLLPGDDAKKIIDNWFNAISRRLTNKQIGEVISKFNKTGLPIFLKLAFEKAKHWRSYDTNISVSDDVQGIINDFIDDLIEEGHDKDFVEHVICYMLCGRYQGLAENEILEILVFDKEYWENKFLPNTHPDHRAELVDSTKIPIATWSRFYLDMELFLTERDADGVPIITFFHRQFVKVLKERYFLIDLETDEKIRNK